MAATGEGEGGPARHGFDRLLAALPGPLRDHAERSGEAQRSWSEGFARARGAWPELEVDAGAFAEHLARRLASVEDLPTLAWPDLYLAFACLTGSDGAVAAFEQHYLGDLGTALERIGLSPEAADEVRQEVRVRLLAPTDHERPEIADYAGRGSLRGWLHVMAARRARKRLARQRRRPERGDDALLVVFDPSADPAMQYMKQAHREHFRDAVRQSLSALTPRERNLLRHHLVDGLSIDEIGLRYGVHRATAARWVARARERLVGGARKLLMRRFSQGRAEVDSMIQFVRSRVDLSLERLLPSDEPEE